MEATSTDDTGAQHTLGPWVNTGESICAPNGRALISVDAIGGEDEDEVAANVALVTASPRLLASLAKLLEVLDDGSDEPELIEARAAVEACKVTA